MAISCPICSKNVRAQDINAHIDAACELYVVEAGNTPPPVQQTSSKPLSKASLSTFFQTPAAKKAGTFPTPVESSPALTFQQKIQSNDTSSTSNQPSRKRSFEDISIPAVKEETEIQVKNEEQPSKKPKTNAFQKAAPLAERMRPTSLDDIVGQELVGPHGVLRGLIEQDRVPSMILWGGSGTGKTTLARCIASMVGCRFVEINSTSSGVAECKKIFAEARGELGLTGRRTIIFCDEIHRFSKSQQDVFLGPVG